MTPKGMHELLKRLEIREIITPQKLGNAIFYQLNFESELAMKTAVLFGSVLEKGEKAGDIDVMFVIEEKKYKAFSKALDELRQLKTKPIQPVLQTFDDLVKNLKKPDKVVLEILKTGKILWGHDLIVNAVKEAI